MISLVHASRWYGQVIGLNDVTCEIGPGITALLGPNGAGKSTLLKLVTGQLKPTTGTVRVFGEAPFANPSVFRRLGYCPEIESSYEEMTGREFVTMLAAMGGLTSPKLQSEVDRSIELVGMTVNANRKIGGYSKGMRQRIKVAQGIVHDPDILILDEPLNGLDPVGRREVSDLLFKLAAQNKCVVVSSHILYEVEQMTKNIMLIHRGRLLAQGDVYHIRSLIDKHPHRIAITTSNGRGLAKNLLDLPGVVSVKLNDGRDPRLEIETREPETFYSRFPEIVLQHGIEVTAFDSPDNNLEAVFRYLIES